MQSGSLVGYGTIEGSLTNSGYLGPSSLETLTVTGNYTQTAGGEMGVQWGTTALVVNSNATLSGTLIVGINPKRPPQAGSTYTAMRFDSLSGEFTNVTVEEGGTVKYTNDSVVVAFK
jgi:outer membrane autotransporter protein